MPVFELGMKFGGGVAVPGAAIPMRLGAGASTAADLRAQPVLFHP